MEYRNLKIDCKYREGVRKAEKVALKLGYRWYKEKDSSPLEYMSSYVRYLYLNKNGNILHGCDTPAFRDDESLEIDFYAFLSLSKQSDSINININQIHL